jgi:hypothetical protein
MLTSDIVVISFHVMRSVSITDKAGFKDGKFLKPCNLRRSRGFDSNNGPMLNNVIISGFWMCVLIYSHHQAINVN